MNTWGHVAICSRIATMPTPQFFNSWTRLIAGGLRQGDVAMGAQWGMTAHFAANELVRHFLSNDTLAHCDSLLFIDDDQAFPRDSLELLRSHKGGKEYDIVGGLYLNRTQRYPLVMRLDGGHDQCGNRTYSPMPMYHEDDATGLGKWQRGDVVRVDLVPLGFTMIRRYVLEALDEPWFDYPPGGRATEDTYFSEKAAAAGFTMAIDTGVPIGHVSAGMLVPYDDMLE